MVIIQQSGHGGASGIEPYGALKIKMPEGKFTKACKLWRTNLKSAFSHIWMVTIAIYCNKDCKSQQIALIDLPISV